MNISRKLAAEMDTQLLGCVTLENQKVDRVLPKRIVERLTAARARGLSYRAIEQRMAKTLKVTPVNGTAAMRLCRIAGIA
jgi:hypothetical protein